jgi:hypothetical protein
MIPYIPADSGLLGTLWDINDSNPYQALIISDDGFTFARIGTNSGTYQLLSYWKGSDSTVIQLLIPGSPSTDGRFARIGISGNTLTWNSTTLTKLDGKTTSIPAESGLRGTTWISSYYTVTFSGDGSTFDRTFVGTGTLTTFTVTGYWKTAGGIHVVAATDASGSQSVWVSSGYTKEE